MNEELAMAIINLQAQVTAMQSSLIERLEFGEKEDLGFLRGRISGMSRALEEIGEVFDLDL